MGISGRQLQSVQAIVKTACTDYVCSGGHCAAVGGFAALRMRRPLYGERAPCRVAMFAAQIHWCNAFRFVIARRPQADAAISAVHSRIVGKPLRIRGLLQEIPTSLRSSE